MKNLLLCLVDLKLSQLCIVLKKVYRFILSISSMTGNVEPSLLV